MDLQRHGLRKQNYRFYGSCAALFVCEVSLLLWQSGTAVVD
ncbi:hypothetical protein WH7805_00875 [Synechococcus sp. WH 7805]|nr:hypothetical protein WH7805_00875 [Synechococcus sp. WH 7805]